MKKAKQNRTKNPIQKITKKAKGLEPETIAKGAAAVSIAAGMIAAGAALMDKENRKKVGKMAGKSMEFMQDMASDMSKEVQDKYQSVQMTVPLRKITKTKSKKRK